MAVESGKFLLQKLRFVTIADGSYVEIPVGGCAPAGLRQCEWARAMRAACVHVLRARVVFALFGLVIPWGVTFKSSVGTTDSLGGRGAL